MNTSVGPGRDSAVLLLRLAGPLQSWGDRSAFNHRRTGHEPTKSGIVGLLAAAQGRAREDDIADLARTRIGVRVDQPGTLLRDFHTVSDYRGRPLPQAGVAASGLQKPTSPAKFHHITYRYYLQDAVFLAAVAGPLALVTALEQAARNPAFPLGLGRRSCVPAPPLCLGVRTGDLLAVMAQEPWQVSDHARPRHAQWIAGSPARIELAATVDDFDGDDVRRDVPLSFDPRRRGFTTRRVRRLRLSVPVGAAHPDASDSPGEPGPGHDPFALLEG